VRSTGLTVDAFTISSTVGGGLFTISTDGAGYVAKATPLTVTAGVQPKIPAGTLIIRRS